MTKVMQGVRVLEVADFVFVPAAGAILADWGADVIKVEHHENGDHMRGQTTFHPNHNGPLAGFNPLVELANRGKRSIGLNLGTPDGLAVLMELAKTCDVFLTSKLAPTRRKLGFDIDDIRRANPDIIFAQGTGHGSQGAEAGSPGFDFIDFWFRSGAALGVKPLEFDFLPMQPGPGFGDLTGSMNLAGGTSAALFHRACTGEATIVDVSLLGSAMWSMGGAVTLSELYNASSSQPVAGRSPNPLVNAFETKDGRWLALCCLQAERYWQGLCKAMQRDDLAANERYATAAGIVEHSDEILALLRAEFRSHSFVEWLDRLASFEGPWSIVQDALTVTQDPQAEANGYLVSTKAADGSDIVVVQPPAQFNGSLVSVEPAPEFNADAEGILGELGYDTETILALKLNNAVA